MKKNLLLLALILGLFQISTASIREVVIENFESGYIPFTSFQDEDLEPDSYEFSTEITSSPESQYSLQLYGNTWKVETISPIQLQADDVWQVDVFVPDVSSIQGFGISDGTNTLFYSFFGHEMLNIEEWVPVYQGIYGTDDWYSFQLPVADDWFAWYDEFSLITQLIFVNDEDEDGGNVYFDDVVNITEDLPIAPEVEISYSTIGEHTDETGLRNVIIQFEALVIDPDSDSLFYFWEFGDGETSNLEDPEHTFVVQDDHSYTVLLQVQDNTGQWGYAICSIDVDVGESSFPIKMNFVGDIILARSMETIINNNGVESIFEPTIPWLGDSADITVANLENPFTNVSTHHPTKTIYFKADPENAYGLSYAGIDIVTLANNHVWDYLYPGLLETQEILDTLNILYSGAGLNSYEAYSPLFYNESGVNIAFLASSDRTGQYNNYQPYLQAGYDKSGFAYMSPYYVQQQIQEVEDVADLIVIETHSGSEYSTAPGANYDHAEIFAGWDWKDFSLDEDYTPRADIPHKWDVEIRHFFIDNGADMVICHHPHIIQGVEIYNGKLIAHSLGNFIFDLTYSETFPSMILNTEINNDGFYKYSITPVFIDDFIPNYASGELGLYLLDHLAMKSKEMNTYLHVDRQQNLAEVIIDTLTMQIDQQSYQYYSNLDSLNGYYSSRPIKLPRNGFISDIVRILPAAGYEFRFGREKIWHGNFEPEGSTEWNVNSDDEWIDNLEQYEGEYSLRQRRLQSAPGNIVTNLENRLKRYSEGKYSIHGYIKTQNGDGVTIQARYFSSRSGGNQIDLEHLGLVYGDTDWSYYHKELTVPEGTNFIDVYCNSEPPGTGESISRFDNVGLIEWTDWQPFGPASGNIINPNDYYYIQVRTIDPIDLITIDFKETNYGNFYVNAGEDVPSSIKTARINSNYPNPFNPTTTISFDLNIDADVELNVFNIKGQKLKTLLNSNLAAGSWNTIWDGKDDGGKEAASGIYFFQLKVNKKQQDTSKCLLLK